MELELRYVIYRTKLRSRVANESKLIDNELPECLCTELIKNGRVIDDMLLEQHASSGKVLSTNDQLSRGVEVQEPGITDVINVDVMRGIPWLSRLSSELVTYFHKLA